MRYQINQTILFKKNHACGSNEWKVQTLGAMIKLECCGCKRVISLLPSDIDSRKKLK
ncbi:DUF951 domain-containing protein [Haploplasma axanthum]|uniref:DUF951 domain-containing protein n=1 Tax=Haploplasma axanthum TaxID=29552 RepID=UPI000A048FEA